MILGLVGPAGAGKGTVADMLVSEGYIKVAFADILKDVVSIMFGWPRHLLEGDTDESRQFRETVDEWWSERFGYPVTPRNMLQLMGTEAGRDVFHKDIWILSLERRIRGRNNVVISDVRFPNEIDFVRKKGGKIVRVRRNDPEHILALNDWKEYSDYTPDDDAVYEFMIRKYPHIHLSEYAWWNKTPDYTLYNTRTLEALKEKVLALISGVEPATLFHHPV